MTDHAYGYPVSSTAQLAEPINTSGPAVACRIVAKMLRETEAFAIERT